MAKFESSIREIPHPQQTVYDTLSDLNHLSRIKDRLPQDKIQNLTFDRDSLSVNVSPVGDIQFAIVDREEPKCIKFETQKSPVPLNFWIQLLPLTATTCKMRLTIKADIPFMLKGMVTKPLTEGIERIADALQAIDYSHL